MPRAMAHIATIGARYGSGGSRSGPTRVSCSIEQRPVLRQVAGQEDDEDDLEELRRLAAERPDLEGQALAVDLGPRTNVSSSRPTPAAAHVYL